MQIFCQERAKFNKQNSFGLNPSKMEWWQKLLNSAHGSQSCKPNVTITPPLPRGSGYAHFGLASSAKLNDTLTVTHTQYVVN